MFDILFARTFLIVGGMLLITALTSKLNKAFEKAWEMWVTVIATFVFLFAILFFANWFPVNIILVAIFSALIGWEIGPVITLYGKQYQLRKYLKSQGIVVKKGQKLSDQQQQELVSKGKEFEREFQASDYAQQWQGVVTQAIFATAFAVFATAGIVFLTAIDFGFLGSILFVALLLLIIMSLLNAFIFHSPVFSMLRAYLGAIIFTLYLLFDFNRLEQMAGDESWGTAVDLAVNLYLDIINLFLFLLEILADSD